MELITVPYCKLGTAESKEAFPPCDQIENSACLRKCWLFYFKTSTAALIYPIHPGKCWQEDSDLNLNPFVSVNWKTIVLMAV